MVTAGAGKWLTASTPPLFTRFRKSGAIDARRSTIASNAFFAPLPTICILSLATVYTVDYAAQAAAAVVTVPLVVLILRRGVVSDPTAGTAAR